MTMLTVTTPATSFDLTTLATVKAELGITSRDGDAKLAGMIRQASGAVSDYCRRVFAQETVVETVRTDRLQPELILCRYPVTSMASVVENDNELDADEYEVNLSNGILTRVHGARTCWWPCGKTVIAYTAGHALLNGLPQAVERACITLVSHLWSAAGRDPLLKANAVDGIGSREYWIGGTGSHGALPPEVIGLLGPHRNRVIR
jgi:uncharacterized phiE125 gp8 family phage protein